MAPSHADRLRKDQKDRALSAVQVGTKFYSKDGEPHKDGWLDDVKAFANASVKLGATPQEIADAFLNGLEASREPKPES